MEKIKRILDSSVGVFVSLNDDQKGNGRQTIIDNRFELIKSEIKEKEDDVYYSKLIKILSEYINKLYDLSGQNESENVLSLKGENIVPIDGYFDYDNSCTIITANRAFAEKLFDYVCLILRKHPDIILDTDSLKALLNKNSKPLSFMVGSPTIDRTLSFKKLVRILKRNNTIKKSNISTDELYDILIATYQIFDNETIKMLVTKKSFKENHKKIDELLHKCNAEYFVKLTELIIENYDKNYDRISMIKDRNDPKFTSQVICEHLEYPIKVDYEFIHALLNNEEIKVDYEYEYCDYIGHCSLKTDLANSGNKTIIKDLLSKEENIEEVYCNGDDGEYVIYLYALYALTGNYEKALELFERQYCAINDYTEDYDNDFERQGYTHASITYKDSLDNFTENICKSFAGENLDYEKKKDIIYKIFNSKNIKYINLSEIALYIKEVLNHEDFNKFLDALLTKYYCNSIKFINVDVNPCGSISDHYKVILVPEEQIIQEINRLRKDSVKTLKS